MWTKVRVIYERPTSAAVRVSTWLDGQFLGSSTDAQIAQEANLSWLTLAADEGTVWFDDVRVTAGAERIIDRASGTPQTTAVSTAFGRPLQAIVRDAANNPVSGATVTFTAPSGGARASLSSTAAVTDAAGIATVTATANDVAGSYLVTAASAGAAGQAIFALTNRTGTLPAAPTFTAPANGAALDNTIVTFSWAPVAGATSYELRLFEASAQQQFHVSVLAANTSAIYTLASGSYTAELQACNDSGCGPSGGTAFRVAGPAIPSSPVSSSSCGLVNDSGQNRLDCNWTPLAGAHFYFIHVVQPTAGPGGGALTVAGRQVSGDSASLLIPNGAASVVIRACTGDGCGPFSAALPINPAFGNPQVPILGEPFAGSSVDSRIDAAKITFTWNRVAGDTGSNFTYRLFVQDFSRNRPATDVFTSNNFHAAYLNPGTRYDALVIAIPNNGGASRQGPPSAFLIRGRAPRSPIVAEPTYGSTVTRDAGGRVRIAWTAAVNVDGTAPGRKFQYFFSGPGQAAGFTTDTFVDLVLAPGAWIGAIRSCREDSPCPDATDTGWGPWSNTAGSEGAQASFTVR